MFSSHQNKNIQKEVFQSLSEKQDEIFVQLSEKTSLDNSVVNDRNVSFKVYEQYEFFPLMSYEDDQQCIQIAEDQGIEDCHSDFSSHVSCLEFLFQEEICSPTCLELFDNQEHTLYKVHYEERS